MGGHAEGNNLLLLAEPVKIGRAVALVTVKNQQAMAANKPPLCILVKVFQPLNTKLICCPASLRDPNNPILRQIFLLVLSGEVVLAGEDDKGWNRPPRRVNALDSCYPLSVALLHSLWSPLTV